MHLMLMFEYRADFLFWGFISAMWTIFNFFFTQLLVSSAGMIGTWSKNEMFLLMAIFTIFDSFTWSFFYFNMRRYTERVFSGELDGFLLKPIDTQFLLSTEHNSYNNLFRLFIGIGVLIYALQHLSSVPTLFQILLAILSMLVGLLIMYSIWFFIATISFWVDRINNINDVIPSLRRLAQIPREVYQGVWSMLFCIGIPLVLVTSIPAEIFTGKAQSQWIAYFFTFAIIAFIACRAFFFFSLRRYSSAGS